MLRLPARARSAARPPLAAAWAAVWAAAWTAAWTATLGLASAGFAAPPAPGEPAHRAPAWHRTDLPHAVPAGRPMRIVSLAPALTETVFALGEGGRLVGVTRFCDRPTDAQALPRVGGATDVSLERLLGLRPDLVLAVPTLGQREVLDRVRAEGIPVQILAVDRLSEVLEMIRTLGATLDAVERADKLMLDIRHALAELKGLRLPPRRTAVVVGADPLVVAGPGTFIADVLALTGLASAVPDHAPMWPTWSAESLAAARAEVFVVADSPTLLPSLRAMTSRAGAPTVLVAPSRPILLRPGPALLEDAPTLAAALREALAAGPGGAR